MSGGKIMAGVAIDRSAGQGLHPALGGIILSGGQAMAGLVIPPAAAVGIGAVFVANNIGRVDAADGGGGFVMARCTPLLFALGKA